LYEYAYKLGVSYKVCIRRLYNALGSDSVCQRLKYYSHSIIDMTKTPVFIRVSEVVFTSV